MDSEVAKHWKVQAWHRPSCYRRLQGRVGPTDNEESDRTFPSADMHDGVRADDFGDGDDPEFGKPATEKNKARRTELLTGASGLECA